MIANRHQRRNDIEVNIRMFTARISKKSVLHLADLFISKTFSNLFELFWYFLCYE